jgi:hypothetical protein
MGHFAAYSDESYTNDRYQSVSVVTFGSESECVFESELSVSLEGSSISEFKWSKLRQARDRFGAMKIIDFAVGRAVAENLRIDTLIWDTEDSRHNISGRDDTENLQRMYYHLFRNVLQRRWPADSTWKLYPDENSALNWSRIEEYLDRASIGIEIQGDIFDEKEFRISLFRNFRVEEIQEVASCDAPICQVADLFAGAGAFSHTFFDKYKHWCREGGGQMSLAFNHEKSEGDPSLSSGEAEKCFVLNYLNKKCKNFKLRVGLESSKGLKTYDPRFPINFWVYQPQHPEDKAPIRGGEIL